MSDKTISLIILFVIIFLTIVYLIIIWETYKNQTFIFAPYNPIPEVSHFFPLDGLIPLTADEIARQQAALEKYIDSDSDDDS